jgi:hypothetical protein
VTFELLLRVALAPLAVGLASLAARRWGHAAAGYLGGMPLIGGPITFFLAQDHGARFAAQSATVTLAAVAGQAAYLLAFAFASRSGRWAVALACGLAAFAVVSAGVAGLAPSLVEAIALAVGGLAIAWIALPHPREPGGMPAVPGIELYLRLAAALALAFAIVTSANVLGPMWSGVLLSIPVTGSIIPAFTLALHGPDVVARVIRGFVVGLTGFISFFCVVAACAIELGVAVSFVLAALAALSAVFVSSRLLKIRLAPP